jgi:phage-related baseplate assembly protein
VATGVLADGTRKRLVSLAPAVLPDGGSEMDVLCEAEQVGAVYNLPDDAYVELVTGVAGIDAVTNGTGWLTVAGVDEEDDQVLIDRVIEGQKSGGEGWIGGDKSYLDITLDFPGVINAVIDGSQPRGRGTVDVIIMGGAGVPTGGLIADLTAELDERGKPITDDVLVRAPTPVIVNVDATAVAYTTDPRTDGAIQTLVEGILDSFFTYGVGSRFLTLGEDYVRARAAGAAIQDVGLKNLSFTTPVADVAVGTGDLAVAGTRAVIVTREAP